VATISDVFAFAAQNADYWTEFLSGGDYPSELTEDEARGLTAARVHIDALVVELLHETGVQLATKLGEGKLSKPRFKPACTIKNRSVTLPAPTGLDRKLYSIVFSLGRNEAGAAIELYASLIVKKGALDTLRQSLDERKVEHSVDGYCLYAKGLALTANADVGALAAQSAEQAVALLSGFESNPDVGSPTSFARSAIPRAASAGIARSLPRNEGGGVEAPSTSPVPSLPRVSG
jgi:hypothetical protein